MSHASVLTLALTALSLGALHTVIGPDHYVPFVALARARRWTLGRTLVVTLLCGLGHIASSVAIGLVGVAAGIALTEVEGVEAARGSLATWALIAFGLAYAAWGLRRAWRNRPHEHVHVHGGSDAHVHLHRHNTEHAHAHGSGGSATWVLFVIFVLGPCEPLIPLLMYPAARHDWSALAGVTATFGVTTLAIMLLMTALGWVGTRSIALGRMERYVHALAGAVLACSGVLVLLLDV